MTTQIEGIPRNVEGAKDLWERDKYHFQKWAVEQSDGFVTNRRTADGGIDGRLYFEGNDPKNLDSMILEVKGGQSCNRCRSTQLARRTGRQRRIYGRPDCARSIGTTPADEF